MSFLASIRPDEWGLPLFIHVLGAMTMIGVLVVAASFLFAGRDGSLEMIRAGYKTLLYGGLPSYLATRLGGAWIADKEGLADSEATWITLGYVTTDGGFLLLVGATVAAGLYLRRARKAEPVTGGTDAPGAGAAGGAAGGTRSISIAAWLVSALLVTYMVMIWVMATKPD